MATAATAYTEGAYAASPKPNSPSISRANNKRKRGSDSGFSTPSRNGPQSRRSASQQFAAQNAGEPTDSANAFNDDSAASGFDLSALQAHQNPVSNTPQQPQGNNMDTAAAALNYPMTVPGVEGSGFQMPADTPDQFQSLNAPANPAPDGTSVPPTPADPTDSMSPPIEAPPSAPLTSGLAKPAVGSSEWHKVRKDNHKEVERRRRETINEGINELAKTVPGCEKNKGSILQRAVQYIQKLQDDQQANIDRFTFERLISDQAITDLSGRLERMQREKEAWKKVAKEAGADVEALTEKVVAEAEAQGEGQGEKEKT